MKKRLVRLKKHYTLDFAAATLPVPAPLAKQRKSTAVGCSPTDQGHHIVHSEAVAGRRAQRLPLVARNHSHLRRRGLAEQPD